MANIPERFELEVFVDDAGAITIRQDASASESLRAVVVDPDDISALIRALEAARRKVRRGAAEEREEITVPAFVYPTRPARSP
jgi:hypothetical protein